MSIGEGAHTSDDIASTQGPDTGKANPEIWGAESLMASRRWDVLSFIPLVAIVALVAMVGALVWIVSRSDDDRARAKLATDALWVEQTLRFQLAVDEDMLVRLALEREARLA